MTEAPAPRDLSSLGRTEGDGRDVAAQADDVSMPSRWRSRVLLPSILLGSALVIVVASSWSALRPRVPVRVVPCVVKTLGGATSSVTLQASGWVEPDPFPVLVSALTDGVVEDVLVLEGHTVDAGQVVARLVSDDARIAREAAAAELALRRAEVDAGTARLAASKEILETLVDRRVALEAARARVAELEAEAVRAGATSEGALASLRALEDELRRKAALVEPGAVSELELTDLTERVEASRAASRAVNAATEAARGKLEEARARESAAARHLELLIEERRDLEIARADLAAARAREALAKARDDEAALRLERTEVRAPSDGVVLERLAAPGTALAFNGAHAPHILHLYDPDKLQVRTDVPIADAALVSIDQRAEIVVEALPDHVFSGQVTRVVHRADIQKNTVEVKVAIEEPRAELKPEMIARVRLLASQTESAGSRQRIFAPEALLQTDGKSGAKALVVVDRRGSRGRVELRKVSPGTRRQAGWIEVLDGLSAGDVLVADPRGEIVDGTRVEITGEADGFEGGER